MHVNIKGFLTGRVMNLHKLTANEQQIVGIITARSWWLATKLGVRRMSYSLSLVYDTPALPPPLSVLALAHSLPRSTLTIFWSKAHLISWNRVVNGIITRVWGTLDKLDK